MMHTFDKVRNICPYKGKTAPWKSIKGGKKGHTCEDVHADMFIFSNRLDRGPQNPHDLI